MFNENVGIIFTLPIYKKHPEKARRSESDLIET